MKKVIRGKEVLRRVLHQGNSLAITIPPDIIEKLGLREGDGISVTSNDEETFTVKKMR